MFAQAHPRSRGENALMFFARTFVFGSSPLTRGKQLQALEDVASLRLIPAHAGKTQGSIVAVISLSAHPRSRGENFVIWRISTRECGSSPLTRGKLRAADAWPCGGRLIPAHAGKT